MSVFDKAFAIVVDVNEGTTLDLTPTDPGNWTGGRVGLGDMLGSQFGFASSQWSGNLARMSLAVRTGMPHRVRDLSPEQAKAAYHELYWMTHRCDDLPGPLAFLVFDAAVNGGAPGLWLQFAVGAKPDGVIGPATIAAVTAYAAQHGGAAICSEFDAERLAYLTSLPTWRTFGADLAKPKGWARRLCALPFQAMTMTA